MRRSFKAATVFAGAAAFAGGAVGLAPAAHASSLRNQACGAASSVHGGTSGTALHLYYPNGDHVAECFGGIGHHDETANISAYCPGNNTGFLSGNYDGTTSSTPILFKAGEGTRSASYHVRFVQISGVGGDAKCPTSLY